ncbi:MAG TPA: hypothetical protein VN257_09240, partial [Actinotalea sp.]|nr:hypothetical protein [Actinotalea sp.]
VAHSMGGLIGRCLLQKVIPDHVRVGGTAEQAADVVDKFFTYATPHGGIEFAVGLGLLERLRDTFGIAGADIFGPQRMWQYLTPVGGPRKATKGWRPQEMPDGAFPKDRIFTLVGTNPGDYDVAMGLSSRAVGVKSDGLVQIENAAIPGARSAYVHRSHSGRYGIVNSEEGYQNLRRFLFGNLNVRTELVGLDLSAGRRGDLVWQAEAELAVRGLPVLMHEQVAAHHCPIQLEPTDHTVQLAATGLFMDPLARPDDAARSRLTLRVRVLALAERRGIFDFTHHLEHGAEFDDQLVVDVGALDGRPAVWAVWGSQIRVLTRDYEPSGPPLRDEDPTVGTWSATMPLPPSATALLGADAAIRITARPN